MRHRVDGNHRCSLAGQPLTCRCDPVLRRRPRSTTSTPSRTSATRTRRSSATRSPAGTACSATTCMYVTGTDEHGLKIQQTAEAAGLDPQAFTDSIAPKFADAWERLNIANDDFIRTTEPRHKAAVAELLQRCYDAGDIELDTFAGKYCVACEEYYADDELSARRRRRADLLPDPPAPRRVLRGGELLLPALALRGPPARLVRRPPDRADARTPRQRGDRADQERPARLLDQPHLARTGASRSPGTTATSPTCGSTR